MAKDPLTISGTGRNVSQVGFGAQALPEVEPPPVESAVPAVGMEFPTEMEQQQPLAAGPVLVPPQGRVQSGPTMSLRDLQAQLAREARANNAQATESPLRQTSAIPPGEKAQSDQQEVNEFLDQAAADFGPDANWDQVAQDSPARLISAFLGGLELVGKPAGTAVVRSLQEYVKQNPQATIEEVKARMFTEVTIQRGIWGQVEKGLKEQKKWQSDFAEDGD